MDYDNDYTNCKNNNADEIVEYLDFDINELKNSYNPEPSRLSEEDLKRIDKILGTKSKNEKTGLIGFAGFAFLSVIFVMFSAILERKLIPILIAILSGILTIIFLGVFLVAYFKRKKISVRKDVDVIKNELAGDDITVFESSKVYLTKNYIVSHGAYSNVLKYDDIALIYNERRISKVNGIKVDNGIFIVAILRSGKNVNIVRTHNEQDIKLIDQVILNRNPYILMGLNEENKEKLKEIKREYKNAKKR